MFTDFSQNVFAVGSIIQFPDFVFSTTPLDQSQIVPTPTTQGSSTNTVYVTGTTQQEG